MKKTLFLCVLVAFCSFFGLVNAQNITVPYSMGFEAVGFDSVEAVNNWVLNPGPQSAACRDKWYIGRAIREAGQQSLYISCDTNQSASYGSRPCTQYVYRDILLPAGTYDISFDWYCEGQGGSYLAMGLAPTTSNYLVANSSSGVIVSQVSAYVQSAASMLNGQSEGKWQNVTLQFQSNGVRASRLFFVWVNNNTDNTVSAAGACIDNLQITSANCTRPANINYTALTCDSVFVSWTGSSAEYELQYRNSGSNYWHKVIGISGGSNASTILEGLSEDNYDIRVRGICAPDTSAWTYLKDFIVFCPEKHCINYVDLYDPDVVTCTYGSGYDGYSTNPQCAYTNIGVIDYGPESKKSRHTVNWDRTALDPRTGNNLPLIPSGEFASVRLGNWETGSEAESVSYLYDVDSTSNILLMKYAVVLEDPDHTANEQPRFVLDILDAHGNLIDPTCGHCDFAANSSATGWRTYGSGYSKVTYKPWTLLGLNLENYQGTTIRIRLTTYDCSQSGHYGYAYFTLGCASATISTTSCASDASVQMSLTAPDGFNYQWYNSQGQMVSQQRILDVASSDTTTYRCRLVSKENANCYFELHSQCMPQQPISEFHYTYNPHDCRNIVEFQETSFIRTTYNNDTVDHRDRKCEEFMWEFWGPNQFQKASNKPNPIIEFPAQGGIYSVKLTSVAGGECAADTVMQITLPKIQDYYFDFDTTLCQGQSIRFGDQIIFESGEHTIPMKTRAGCDSTIHLTVAVNPTYQLTLDTMTICYGDDYCVGDDCYGRKSSGMFIRTLPTVLGCDSTLMQWIIVRDSIAPVVVQDSIDLDAMKFTADLHFTGTGYNRIVFNGDTLDYDGTNEVLINGLGVGYYEIEYLNDFGCSVVETILVGGACLGITMDEQTQCQGYTPVVEYPFTVDSGMVTFYSIRFGDDAKAVGFTDTTNCEPKKDAEGYSIVVPVPADVVPGIYEATIVFADPVCGDLPVPVTVTVTYPASIMFTRWGDLISLKNAAAAGYAEEDYTFKGFQWVKDGMPIVGAIDSYWYQEGGLDMNAEYSVILILEDGTVLETCPLVPAKGTAIEDAEADVFLMTNVGLAGHMLPVGVGSEAKAEIYSATGQLLSEQNLHVGTNLVQLPRTGGIYIMNVHTRKGTVTSRIVVK